jgi:hypothetical protein
MSAGKTGSLVPNHTSPAVAQLDDGSFVIRQGGNVIRLSPAQVGVLVDELQRLRFPPRKQRDWDCV